MPLSRESSPPRDQNSCLKSLLHWQVSSLPANVRLKKLIFNFTLTNRASGYHIRQHSSKLVSGTSTQTTLRSHREEQQWLDGPKHESCSSQLLICF